jgi:hypothetical protein
MKVNSWRKQLESKRRGGAKEYPVGTLLFYGPDDRRASKVVAAVVHEPGGDETVLERWVSDTMDVRMDPRIGREVTRFFDRHKVRRVMSTPGLAGCPHEEGTDYPDGEACPRCPFWADLDRWEIAARPAVPPGHMSN